MFSKKILFLIPIICFACRPIPQYTSNLAADYSPDYKIDRFEKSIKAFEKEDSLGITQDAVVLYGSSSFFYWKTSKADLSPATSINRGFGGSTIPELIHYAERTIFKYNPKKILIYGGENDLSDPKIKTPEQVLDSYRQLTAMIAQRLPNAQVYFVSMKPSIARKALWPTMQRGNALIKAYSKHKNLHYIDITQTMLKPDGEIDGSIFTKDSLHMNAKGYARWTKIIQPIVGK
jgi:lysophospholipase L1-like esterase